MSNTAIVPMPQSALASADAMSIGDVLGQVALIQDLLQKTMKEGEHYGKIPGCGDKPTLLQPGAQKLLLTFRMCPDYDIQTVEMPHSHREYRVTCRLTNMNGVFIGAGVGSASTMESKWRYRWDATGKPVPKEYWNTRDAALLGGPQYVARKTKDGGWQIYQRAEHDNPADYYNTVLKMGKKRALVDATLTRTAASDLFTQDIEEIRENMEHTTAAPEQRQEAAEPTKAQPRPEPKRSGPPAGATLQNDVTVLDIVTKTGISANGKPWTLFFVKCEDENGQAGEFGTFDTKLADAATVLKGQMARIAYKPGRKEGSFELVDIQPLDD